MIFVSAGGIGSAAADEETAHTPAAIAATKAPCIHSAGRRKILRKQSPPAAPRARIMFGPGTIIVAKMLALQARLHNTNRPANEAALQQRTMTEHSIAVPGDTIAAVATAPGEGAISIVRISGARAVSVAGAMFVCRPPGPSGRPTRSVAIGRIVDARKRTLDKALMLIMRAPQSFTGEDVVEFQFHGGPILSGIILGRAIECGCRPAAPGEFARRAFLNGKIDLVQAEAVMELVRATSDRAAAVAIEQLDGALSRRINAIYDNILSAASDLEALLDFPEEEMPKDAISSAKEAIARAASDCVAMADKWRESCIVRDGAIVPLVGKTNAGKSSIFNALLGRDRAIVSQTHGTTRDTIEESVLMDGFRVRLVDTAGLRDSDCPIESEGVRRTMECIESADIVIHVIDSSQNVDMSHFIELTRSRQSASIVILNKSDLPVAVSPLMFKDFRCVCMSALTSSGLDDLRNAIKDILLSIAGNDHSASVSERHRISLVLANDHLRVAEDILHRNGDRDMDIAASHLRNAMEAVGAITGRSFGEDILDSIFAKFCVGK